MRRPGRTVETGFATFYSRSRNKLWMKGESSGHHLVVKSIQTDCDQDSVLVQVEASAPASATRATRAASSARSDGDWQVTEARTYDPQKVYSK